MNLLPGIERKATVWVYAWPDIVFCRDGCYEDLFANVENYPAVFEEKKVFYDLLGCDSYFNCV